MADRTCSIDGCERPVRSCGWCNMHHLRWLRTGSTYRAPKLSPEDSFWSKVEKNGPPSRLGTRCWNWTGYTEKCGYGRPWYRGKKLLAHQISYMLIMGTSARELDHMCHNTLCVNPDHLRPVNHKQNGENKKGVPSNNTSGVLGVSWSKASKRWKAYVGHNGKKIHVGFFLSIADAEAAVIAKRNELFTHNDLDRVA